MLSTRQSPSSVIVPAIDPGPVSAAADFAAMRTAFARAAAARPTEVQTSRLCLGRRAVRLTIVGDDLARRIGATFAHLCDDDAAAGETGPAIELWDRTLAGVAPPPLRAAAELAWGRNDWRMTTHEGHRYIREERPERSTVRPLAWSAPTDPPTCRWRRAADPSPE